MAQRIKGITIEIGGDTTNLDKALGKVNEKTKELKSELKGVNSLLKMDPSNVTLLKQKQDILNQSIATTQEKLTTLKNAQVQVQAQFDKGQITSEQYRDFQREIVATENKLKSLTNELKTFGSIGAQQVAAVGEKMKDTGEKIGSAGKKMLGVTATVTGLTTAVTYVGSNFDSSMKQVAATMGITADEIEKGSEPYKILEDAAKECGETTKYSASEAAQALNYLALAGYDAEKSAETLPKVLNLAAAGGLDLATASDMVTDAMAALGLETKDLDKYIDEMAKTSQKSNTSVAQLGEATLECAGTVSMAGMSLETMNAELGILANNGIKGAEGGTHLRNIILSLTSPTDTASKALQQLGINVLDSQGNVRDLNAIMGDFNTKLDGLSDGEKTEIISTIFNKTDISAVNALIKGSGEEFANLTKELSNCDGSAQDMADTMNSSFSGQLTLLKSQIEGIAIKFSEILLPILTKIVNKVSEFLTWLSNLNPAAQKIVVVVLAIVAAIGPLLIVVGKLTSSIGSILTYGPKIVSVFGTIKTVVGGLFSLIDKNTTILAITAIIAAIVLLWTKCEWFRDLVTKMFEAIQTVVGAILPVIVKYFQQTWNNIKAVWDIVQPYFMALWDAIQKVFSVVVQVLGTIFETAWEVIKTVWNAVYPYFQLIWDSIQSIFSVVSDVIGGYFQVAWTVIQTIWNNVTGYFQAIWDTIKGIFSVATAIFHGDFSGAWDAIKGIVGTWISYFEGVWEGIKNVFSSVATFFKSIFSNAWNAVKNVFSTGGKIFDGIKEGIANVFKSVVNTLIRGINTVVAIPFNAINGMLNKIRSTEIPIIKQKPFKGLWKEDPIAVPAIPQLRTGGSIIGDGDAIMAEAGSPEMITMMNGKAIVRPLTSTDRKEVISSTNSGGNNTFNFYSPNALTPSEERRKWRKEVQFQKLLNG